MTKLSFFKMNGAGNDFIVYESVNNTGIVLNQETIVKLCCRKHGIGADGVIVINESDSYDFDMSYYNADGSLGSLCGNGSRVALFYGYLMIIKNKGLIKNEIQFTLDKVSVYNGMVLSVDNHINPTQADVKFFLNNIPNRLTQKIVEVNGQLIHGIYLDTGSPHFLINIEENKLGSNIKEVDVFGLGSKIRHSLKHFPNGTNVNFYKMNPDLLEIRTYERGVENETLACGTGSVALGIVAHAQYSTRLPIRIKTKSEKILEIDFSINSEEIENISLKGPAQVDFIGQISI